MVPVISCALLWCSHGAGRLLGFLPWPWSLAGNSFCGSFRFALPVLATFLFYGLIEQQHLTEHVNVHQLFRSFHVPSNSCFSLECQSYVTVCHCILETKCDIICNFGCCNDSGHMHLELQLPGRHGMCMWGNVRKPGTEDVVEKAARCLGSYSYVHEEWYVICSLQLFLLQGSYSALIAVDDADACKRQGGPQLCRTGGWRPHCSCFFFWDFHKFPWFAFPSSMLQ